MNISSDIIIFFSILDFSILQNLKGSTFDKSSDMGFHHLNSTFLISVFFPPKRSQHASAERFAFLWWMACVSAKRCSSVHTSLGRSTLGQRTSWWTVYEYACTVRMQQQLCINNLPGTEDSRYSSWSPALWERWIHVCTVRDRRRTVSNMLF